MTGRFGAVIVAAGNSTRMGGTGSKVLLPLCGKPVLAYSLDVLDSCDYVTSIAVVCREEDMPAIQPLLDGRKKPAVMVPGGKERQDSVQNGIAALEDCDYLLIHDGARPLLSPELCERVCRETLVQGAAAAAVKVKDTCKLADAEGFVEQTPPRDRLYAVQTPQCFSKEMYLYAVEKASMEEKVFTDDCQLIEAAGGKVRLVEGDYKNLKITTPEDLLSAQIFIKGENAMRVGTGYDVHRLGENRKLILGGVEIPYHLGLVGHSDADVLAHAISDALLGAAAMGDIGKLFPDNDPAYEGADSLKLLQQVCEKIREKGYSIGNIDATVIAQKPKLAPYIQTMRQNLAESCGISADQVSVKATTEEGLGFTGEGLGIAASAICLLV